MYVGTHWHCTKTKSFRFPVVFCAHIYDTNNEKLHCKTSRGGEGRTRPRNNRMGHGKKFFGETKRGGKSKKVLFLGRSSSSWAAVWPGPGSVPIIPKTVITPLSPSLPDPNKLCSFCREWSRSKKGFLSLWFASYFQEKVGKCDLFKQKLFYVAKDKESEQIWAPLPNNYFSRVNQLRKRQSWNNFENY